YIVGSEPIKPDRSDIFFGRRELIDTIRRQLLHSRNRNVVLLEGNRRTGKSSILWHLTREGELPGWIPVFCDLQGAEGAADREGIPTHNVYRLLTRAIGGALADTGLRPWFPGEPGPDRGRPFKLEFRRVLDRVSSDRHPFEAFQLFLEEAL